MRTSRNVRAPRSGRLLLAALALGLAGCGGRPAPVEVTEPWTSGDERALGIEDPEQPPRQASSEAGAGEVTAPSH